jgi:hypothetical protein
MHTENGGQLRQSQYHGPTILQRTASLRARARFRKRQERARSDQAVLVEGIPGIYVLQSPRPHRALLNVVNKEG